MRTDHGEVHEVDGQRIGHQEERAAQRKERIEHADRHLVGQNGRHASVKSYDRTDHDNDMDQQLRINLQFARQEIAACKARHLLEPALFEPSADIVRLDGRNPVETVEQRADLHCPRSQRLVGRIPRSGQIEGPRPNGEHQRCQNHEGHGGRIIEHERDREHRDKRIRDRAHETIGGKGLHLVDGLQAGDEIAGMPRLEIA